MSLIKDFLTDCQARGLAKHTVETYKSNVGCFLEKNPDPGSVTLEDLRRFLGDLKARGLQDPTIKIYFASISSLYDYCIFEGSLEYNPVLPFRKRYLRSKVQDYGENSRQLISVQDMQLLVSAAPGIQDLAIIMTLAKTGMRRGEFLDLKRGDIDLKRGLIRISPKAKRTNRLAFIDSELLEVLGEYISWRSERAARGASGWLWISDRGRIHKDYPGKIIAALGEDLGFHDPAGPLCSKLTPHCFRHWFTTWLFRAGMNPQYIMWLRGDSMRQEAWQIYNHIDPEEVRQEYLRCIPKLLNQVDFKLISTTKQC